MKYSNQVQIIKNKSEFTIDFDIIDKKLDLEDKAVKREVVRGISIQDRKILVVYPKDELIYGTPGAGIESNETMEEALKREMFEEVGADDLEIVKYLGKMTSIRKKPDEDLNFIPTHHLYLVNIKRWGVQNLIEYEQALGLKYAYIDIDDVIKTNEQALINRDQKYLDFYTNQTILFKHIKELLIDHQ